MRRKLAAVLGMVLLTMLGASATVSAKDAPAPPPALPPGVTTPDQCSGKQIYYFFQYNDSAAVGFDSGCNEGNEVTRATNPGLIATSAHVSCSDKFEGGLPQKGNLGDSNRRVVAYYILKGDKTCGFGTPDTGIPAGGLVGGAIVAAGLAGAAVVVQRRRRTADIAA